MGLMALMILLVNTSLSTARNITERDIMKVALEMGRYGVLLMVNYESLFFFVARKVSARRCHYDGIFGKAQYVLSFAIVFCSLVTLESVTLTLTPKVQVAP